MKWVGARAEHLVALLAARLVGAVAETSVGKVAEHSVAGGAGLSTAVVEADEA